MAKRKVEMVEIPQKERVGRCGTCGNGSFELRLHKGELLRLCPKCTEVINPDTGEIRRNGKW